MTNVPRLIKGALFSDNRGVLKFVNDFSFEGVKRFYQASNHALRFVRAWQGHRLEGKYVYVASGSARIGVVPLPDSSQDHSEAASFELSESDPSVLWIPPGYANGWMNLSQSTTLFFFSTANLEESKADDLRFPPDRWNIWE